MAIIQRVWGESEQGQRLREIYALPFYMEIHKPGMAAPLAALGRAAPAQDILDLLASSWRPRKVGAWLALVRSEDAVRVAVMESLTTSLGLLTSPELSVAAVTLAGADARPALVAYRARHLANDWGSTDVVDQALRWIDSPEEWTQIPRQEPSNFQRLMDLGQRIRSSDTTSRHRVMANLSFPERAAGHGRLHLPSKTWSLLLQPGDGGPILGCVITRIDGADISAGDLDIPVVMEFWDTDADSRLAARERFVVLYGREEGWGEIIKQDQ